MKLDDWVSHILEQLGFNDEASLSTIEEGDVGEFMLFFGDRVRINLLNFEIFFK